MRSTTYKAEHYAALDGVRGLSAIFVLIFHTGHWLDIPSLAVNGGLSVDTFFTLSGFVLARAYTNRSDRLSNIEFLLQRLARLMPMILISLLISVSYVFLRNHITLDDTHTKQTLFALLLGILNIPYFYAPFQIGGPQVFPLNGPQFSLFFEIIANSFWWSIRRINQLYSSAVLYVVFSCLVINFGIGGDQADNFIQGFYHVGSSFFVGVFCYHIKSPLARQIDLTPAFYVLITIMIIVFVLPYELDFSQRMLWKMLLAPLLVLSGSFVRLSHTQTKLSILFGDLSYPVYALHYPIFCWVNGVCQKISGVKSVLVEVPIFIFVVLSFSYLALQLYDKPLRAGLTRLLRAARKPSPSYSSS